jgi:hypothetical protein
MVSYTNLRLATEINIFASFANYELPCLIILRFKNIKKSNQFNKYKKTTLIQ